jgi:hypothetical protein
MSDQAVVMPSSSFGSAIEKIGMQFGSVSLGGDDVNDNITFVFTLLFILIRRRLNNFEILQS